MPDSTLVTSSIGVSATLAADATIAAEPTMAGDGPRATPGGPDALSAAPPSSTLARATVLPRLQMVGATPRLVTQGKVRYEHTRRLGEGGLGEVLGARDNDIDRDVAVKRLRPDVSSPATIARFVEEVRTIGRLEHPNIVPR